MTSSDCHSKVCRSGKDVGIHVTSNSNDYVRGVKTNTICCYVAEYFTETAERCASVAPNILDENIIFISSKPRAQENSTSKNRECAASGILSNLKDLSRCAEDFNKVKIYPENGLVFGHLANLEPVGNTKTRKHSKLDSTRSQLVGFGVRIGKD
ncbi:hypothetical protein BDN70DRAFT_899372 [Pholiota conissans]|uniref:Uncharacterized protein n=1 Tax=Pholiota conissans TaxID=109636 RepID=A0A9P5YU48_9AGAR|nr:hypothetical protein BDN70DRAFT_899372 [Pholiota conissans]